MVKSPVSNKHNLFIIFVASLFTFVACSNSFNTEDENLFVFVPFVEVHNQGTSNGNQVVIAKVESKKSGWIVIQRSKTSNDGAQVPEIIGKAMVESGSNSDVSVQLKEGVANDETLWVILHKDTGTIGEYEFDGENGLDLPVTFNDEIVMRSFMINQTDPEIIVADQVNQGNIFTVSVDAAEAGWIVIRGPNGSNDGPQIPEIIGKTAVSAGINKDVEIILNEGETTEAGDNLFPMLHFDTGEVGVYEFDGVNGLDQPVFFKGTIVLQSFTVLENSSKP